MGKDDDGLEAAQPLNHPSQLNVGDIIKMSFLDQSDLSNKRFEVKAVNSYDFGSDPEISFTLKGESGKVFFLTVCSDNGEEKLSFSKIMKRAQVTELFQEQAFGQLFNEGADTRLERQAIPTGFEEWTAASYVEEEDCLKGYYYKGDYRKQPFPRFEDESSGVEYYLLEDPEKAFAIEVEVYASGETEVSATLYLDLSAIEEMWPAT
ncbi:MAG: hypothetical protein Q9M14_00505 [Mariprofundaceae bacterium]|nr:hypothetical protein [Mariprofundaceae bacterium]